MAGRLLQNRRAVGLVVVALLMALGAGGCSQIPTNSTPIIVGNAPTADPGNGGQPLTVLGPEKGASTTEVVRGFLGALVSNDPTFEKAREFLTPDAAKDWQPGSSVSIIDSSSSIQQNGAQENVVTFSGGSNSMVDSQGVFRNISAPITRDYTLNKIDGQWRIANPPDTLPLTRSDFDLVYSRAILYFVDPTGTRVIPDLRYFPQNYKQRANTLIEGLITGPSNALAAGVRNELASPIKLKTGVVSEDSGELHVDLTGMPDKNGAQLRALSAQILWTLRDISVKSVRITVDGQPLDVSGVSSSQTPADWESYDPDAFGVNLTGYFVAGGAVFDQYGAPLAGPAGSVASALSSAAISVDATELAAISSTPAGPEIVAGPVAGPIVRIALPGTTSLSTPSWGAQNDEFWVMRNGTDIVRVPVKGQPSLVAMPDRGDILTISSLRLSRDGTRAAIIGQTAKGPHLYLATVIRDTTGVSLGEPVLLAADLSVSSVTWLNSTTLLFFGDDGPRSVPYRIPIDDSTRSSFVVPLFSGRAISIAAAPNRTVLCAGDGTVLQLVGSTWVSLITGKIVSGSNPFYPG